MNVLLAIGHAEIQQFIAQNPRTSVVDTVHSVEELYIALDCVKADTLIVSRHLPGNHRPIRLIQHITEKKPRLRLIYLYGEEDEETQEFVRFMKGKTNAEYYIGANITSEELEGLLYRNGNSNLSLGGFFKNQREGKSIRELDSAVITLYSNCTSGKSHTAWNMAYAMGVRGYRTTVVNLDRGYSANLFFGIEDVYYDLLDFTITQEAYKTIIDNCYSQGRVSVITGRLGSEESIAVEAFSKLLYFVRSNSDIVIIDAPTGLTEITMQAVNNSSIDFLIFDCDIMHFHMNRVMLEDMGDGFLGSKTYGIINNCSTGSEAYKHIYKQINRLDVGLKGILHLQSCGSLSCDLMATGRAPYQYDRTAGFSRDMDNILGAINSKKASGRLKQIFT